LSGIVPFHLRPTFANPVFDVPVADGAAETSPVSYEAFTVDLEAGRRHNTIEIGFGFFELRQRPVSLIGKKTKRF